jgi:hypothetical protein
LDTGGSPASLPGGNCILIDLNGYSLGKTRRRESKGGSARGARWAKAWKDDAFRELKVIKLA